jgi:hypothetical protein
MLLAQALSELLAALECGKGVAVFGFDDIQHWGEEFRTLLVELKLIREAPAARILECHGCEERCLSDIVTATHSKGNVKPFIICEVPEKQAEMGRVAVHPQRMLQWEIRAIHLAQFVADKLGLDAVMDTEPDSQRIRLGMLAGPQGRRWAVLSINPLVLEVNQHPLPLNELLFVENGTVALDTPRIRACLAQDKQATGKVYQPNTDRREARRQGTQAMYQDWRDTYEQLLREHPGKSKSWYAQKIARMDVGQGKNSETIRKRLS